LFYLKPVRALLRIFFHFLYHQFAFAYDIVAAVVSFGEWKNWIQEVVPFINGTRVLEIGHGPGHLQRILLSRNLVAVAIDESAAMGKLAQRNTDNTARLTRGLAQQLPFADASFDTVIATFPAEYITDSQTLLEVKRCLSDGGRFVVLPGAMPKNGFLSWLFKVTAQAPSDATKVIQNKFEQPFIEADFKVETHVLDLKSSTLVILVAKKHLA
jgi:ubiquinone/menaquinone biosynthesis C-methylase UbiE